MTADMWTIIYQWRGRRDVSPYQRHAHSAISGSVGIGDDDGVARAPHAAADSTYGASFPGA